MSGFGRHFCAVLGFFLIGCSGETRLVPVEGTVSFAGQPVTGGVIVFCPDSNRGNDGPLAQAAIAPDGHFSLLTDGKPGAIVGWHRITLTTSPQDLNGSSLPGRYSNPDLSGQSYEVKQTQPNNCQIRLD